MAFQLARAFTGLGIYLIPAGAVLGAWGVYVWGVQKSTVDNLGPFLVWAFLGALGVVFALIGAVMAGVGIWRLGGVGAAVGPALVALGALAVVLAWYATSGRRGWEIVAMAAVVFVAAGLRLER